MRRTFALLLLLAACDRPDYGRATSSSDAGLTVSFADVEAPQAAAIVEARPAEPEELRFEDAAGALAHICDETQSPIERAECRKGAMGREIDRLGAGDEARAAQIAAHQAEWSRYVDVSCSLVEDTFWLDLDAGVRDDGTRDLVAFPTCRGGAYTERFFFARALASGDTGALARWVGASASRGEASRAAIGRMRLQMDALQALDAGAPLDASVQDAGIVTKGSGKFHTLDAGEKKKLAWRVLFVQFAPANLSRVTCKLFPDLAGALGGEEPCKQKLALYYFAHAHYGRSY